MPPAKEVKSRACPSAIIILSLTLLLWGCSGNAEVHEVNRAALSQRPSITDEESRRLAAKRLALAAERRQDYRVGPEDVLEITIFEWELREETKTIEVRVSETGRISLPVIGELKVTGETVEDIKKRIETVLRDGGFIKEPRVSVIVKEFRSKRIAVVGAVTEPGLYTLRQNVTTLLDVLSLAGGLDGRAGQTLYVTRAPDPSQLKPGEELYPEVIKIDLYELLERGDLSLNVVLANGDVINVPQAPEFYVYGGVVEPGGFPLKRPTTVLAAVAMARGLKQPYASPRSCVIRRRDPAGEEIILPVDLLAIAKSEQPNEYLQPGDIVDVQESRTRRFFIETWEGIKAIFAFTIGVGL